MEPASEFRHERRFAFDPSGGAPFVLRATFGFGRVILLRGATSLVDTRDQAALRKGIDVATDDGLTLRLTLRGPLATERLTLTEGGRALLDVDRDLGTGALELQVQSLALAAMLALWWCAPLAFLLYPRAVRLTEIHARLGRPVPLSVKVSGALAVAQMLFLFAALLVAAFGLVAAVVTSGRAEVTVVAPAEHAVRVEIDGRGGKTIAAMGHEVFEVPLGRRRFCVRGLPGDAAGTPYCVEHSVRRFDDLLFVPRAQTPLLEERVVYAAPVLPPEPLVPLVPTEWVDLDRFDYVLEDPPLTMPLHRHERQRRRALIRGVRDSALIVLYVDGEGSAEFRVDGAVHAVDATMHVALDLPPGRHRIEVSGRTEELDAAPYGAYVVAAQWDAGLVRCAVPVGGAAAPPVALARDGALRVSRDAVVLGELTPGFHHLGEEARSYVLPSGSPCEVPDTIRTTARPTYRAPVFRPVAP